MPKVMVIAMITDRNLYRLMTWLSPSFPVGAFAYSHGLEYAIEIEAVRDRASLTRWLDGVLDFGTGRTDAAFLRAAWQAVTDENHARLARIAEQAEALRGTSELALECRSQGRAFLETVSEVWPNPGLTRWRDDLAAAQREPAYAVAVGVVSGFARVPLKSALVAYLNAFAANLVSAGVRLIPLGQTDGQRALAALEEVILSAADAALRRPGNDMGSAALTVDWMSMQHETQYTRLFRS